MINVEKKKEKKKMSCHAICSVMLTMTCGSCGAIIDGGEVGQLSNYNDLVTISDSEVGSSCIRIKQLTERTRTRSEREWL